MNYKNFLQSLIYFKNISLTTIEKIVPNILEKRFGANEIVFQENSEGDKIYIIYEGVVEVYKNYGKQNQKLLSVLTKGEMFWKASLFHKVCRSATAVVKKNSIILEIDSQFFLNIFKNYSEEGIKIVQSILLNNIFRLEQTSKELSSIYSISKIMIESITNMSDTKTFIKNVSVEIENALSKNFSFGIYLYNNLMRYIC